MLSLAKTTYSRQVTDKERCTKRLDLSYTLLAPFYDAFIRVFPLWKKWLRQALPHIRGPKVLEVSFGIGYLISQYADKFETSGIDYNASMVALTSKKLARKRIAADIRQGTVEALPYADESFDTVVNTMAFSAYPDAEQAMSELHRVLKKGGKLVLIDTNYPKDGNRLGTCLTNVWKWTGDMIRDLDGLLQRVGFEYTDEEIGAGGSIHLYVATKRKRAPTECERGER